MKLDGEVAYYHSNIIHEPESQSFEFDDDDDLGSAICKSGSQKVNKNENQDLTDLKRRNEGDITLPPVDKVGEEGFTESNLDSHIDNADLRSDNEATFTDPSQDIGCVKKSSDVIIPCPPQKRELFENLPAIYMDKGVTECEPELVICYKESTYHLIKDICVDEGVPAKDKILFEQSADENEVYKFLPSESCENKELMKDNSVNAPLRSLLDLLASDGPEEVYSDHYQSKGLMQRNKEATEKSVNNICTEMVSHEDKVLSQELDTEESGQSVDNSDKTEKNYAQVSGDSKFQSETEESQNRIEEPVLASSSMAGDVDELNSDILLSDSMQEIGNIDPLFDPSAPSAPGKEESHQVGDCKSDEIQIALEQADGKLDDQAIMSQIRHSLGESSFSVVGPVSGRLSYSGPVPYSGSISLRSDSSTTSTRSFAFPVLQTEWNSSPVRMVKADRRSYRKHRGWRHGLLCCKF